MVRRKGDNGEKGTGNKKHKWWVENRQEEGKNSIRNREAKKLTCMTHTHELSGGKAGGKGVEGRGG